MFAISPRGVGAAVGARSVQAGWPLAAGEAFVVADWSPDLVLAEDGRSLRKAKPAELTAIAEHPMRRRELEEAGIAFVAPSPKVDSVQEKLARVGLTVDELKTALKP